MQQDEVIIAGAGPVGLTAALALAEAGIAVTVAEKPSTGAACMMSSALPSATRPFSSTRQICAATDRFARACAISPPSSPAPRTTTRSICRALL